MSTKSLKPCSRLHVEIKAELRASSHGMTPEPLSEPGALRSWRHPAQDEVAPNPVEINVALAVVKEEQEAEEEAEEEEEDQQQQQLL